MLHVSLHCMPDLQKKRNAAKATARSEEGSYPEIMDLWKLFNSGRIKADNAQIFSLQVKHVCHRNLLCFRLACQWRCCHACQRRCKTILLCKSLQYLADVESWHAFAGVIFRFFGLVLYMIHMELLCLCGNKLHVVAHMLIASCIINGMSVERVDSFKIWANNIWWHKPNRHRNMTKTFETRIGHTSQTYQ